MSEDTGTPGVPRAVDLSTAAVVVVNFGAHRLVAQALDELDATPVRVIVVDNWSDGAERTAIDALAANRGWQLVAAAANGGFGAGVNRGVARARELGCDTVVTLNPDARMPVAVLHELVGHSRREPTALVAPTVVTPSGRVEFGGAFLDLRDGRLRGNHGRLAERRPGELHLDEIERAPRGGPRWRGWLTGACFATSIDLFERLDGFDESYFLYWEDVDLSLRARALGASLIVRTDLRVVHDEGGTQGERQGRAKSAVYYRYNTRNRLLLAGKHVPWRRRLWWLAVTPRVSWEILLRGGRRQLLSSRAPLVAIVLGSLAGVRLALAAPVSGAGASADPVRPADGPAVESVTVAVLTFRRPHELDELLPMLAEQAAELRAARGVAVELLVVDNDPRASARPTVAALDLPHTRYAHEPAPGIAAARNRALDEAFGTDAAADAVAFIDDDERPAPGWLAALVATANDTGAAAVAGAMVPVHATEPEPFVAAGRFFVRPRHTTGATVAAAGAGNLLVRREPIERLGLRFDPAFGTTGGEDTLFTRMITGAGEQIVWCDEAVALDPVPAERANRDWVLTRAFSSGNSASRVELRLRPGAGTRAGLLAGGALRWLAGRARAAVGRLAGRPVDHARGLRTAGRGCGMMAGALGHAYEEYRRV